MGMINANKKSSPPQRFRLSIQPLTVVNWEDLLSLFGENGACGNCWCMYYRLKKPDFESGKTSGKNKKALRKLVTNEEPTGVIGYIDQTPVAWCALAPREQFIRLENSRIHKRIDNQHVWSIPCLFVKKEFRRNGVSLALLKGVASYARKCKINTIEAYPLLSKNTKLPGAFAWPGMYSAFKKAGFETASRKSKSRPIVRLFTNAP